MGAPVQGMAHKNSSFFPQLFNTSYFCETKNVLVRKPLVIFTTAYPQYALQSYDYDAVDYLVKPIPFERFVQALNKTRERMSEKPLTNPEARRRPETLFIKTDYTRSEDQFK